MNSSSSYTLPKSERICSKLEMERLFGGGGKAISAYPIRAVFRMEEATAEEPKVKILVSVPKKCFKRAVKRNRVKRQLRESYRLNKLPLTTAMDSHDGHRLNIAFIWLDSKLWDTSTVEKKVQNLLARIEEKITNSNQ